MRKTTVRMKRNLRKAKEQEKCREKATNGSNGN